MFYGPNVLFAFMGAGGILIMTLATLAIPHYRIGLEPQIGLTESLQQKLDQADIDISVSEFMKVSVLLGVGIGIAAFVLAGAPAAFPLGVVLGLVGYWTVLEDRREKRRRQYQEALATVVDLFRQAGQASNSLQMSIQFVADHAPQILKNDFQVVDSALMLGTSLPEALQAVALKRRDLIFDRLTEALVANYIKGGELAPVLVPLGDLVRGLSAARRRIATSQARIRWEARIVCLAPLAFIVILRQTAPELEGPFYSSIWGQIAIVAIGIMSFLAYYLMNRIGQRAIQTLETTGIAS